MSKFSDVLSDFKLKFKNIFYKLENIEFYFWGPRFRKEFDPDDYMRIIKMIIQDIIRGNFIYPLLSYFYFISNYFSLLNNFLY